MRNGDGVAGPVEEVQGMPVVEDRVVVVNSLGIHARPAAALVQRMLAFECEVLIANDGAPVNAKSIMGLLTLAATRGSQLKVICRGDDAEEAMAAIKEIFAAGFGES